MAGNLFIQAWGQKKWLLYPAYCRSAIDAPAARHSYYFSDVNPYDVDHKRYPLFKHLDALEVLLEPGDIFWNPAFMWHCVSNPTASIGIGYRFNDLRSAYRASATLTFLRFFATRPTIFRSLLYTQKKTNLIMSIETKGKSARLLRPEA